MRTLEDEFKKVNLFVEVRDSRIPLTSQNTVLQDLLPENLKKVVVYNKFDLAS